MSRKSWNQACLDYLHESVQIPKPCCSIIMAYHGTLELWAFMDFSGKVSTSTWFTGDASEFKDLRKELDLALQLHVSLVANQTIAYPRFGRVHWYQYFSTGQAFSDTETHLLRTYEFTKQFPTRPFCEAERELQDQTRWIYYDQGFLAQPHDPGSSSKSDPNAEVQRINELNRETTRLMRLAISLYCRVDHELFCKAICTPIYPIPYPARYGWIGCSGHLRRLWFLYDCLIEHGLHKSYELARQFVNGVDQLVRTKQI